MSRPSEDAVRRLCGALGIEDHLFRVCLEESVIDVYETEDGALEFANGTLLRLRRIERLCLTFEVDAHVALMLSRMGKVDP
jgi:hypothetical protein